MLKATMCTRWIYTHLMPEKEKRRGKTRVPVQRHGVAYQIHGTINQLDRSPEETAKGLEIRPIVIHFLSPI